MYYLTAFSICEFRPDEFFSICVAHFVNIYYRINCFLFCFSSFNFATYSQIYIGFHGTFELTMLHMINYGASLVLHSLSSNLLVALACHFTVREAASGDGE